MRLRTGRRTWICRIPLAACHRLWGPLAPIPSKQYPVALTSMGENHTENTLRRHTNSPDARFLDVRLPIHALALAVGMFLLHLEPSFYTNGSLWEPTNTSNDPSDRSFHRLLKPHRVSIPTPTVSPSLSRNNHD